MNESDIINKAAFIVFSKLGLSVLNIQQTVQVLRKNRATMSGEEFLQCLHGISVAEIMNESLKI